MTERKLLKSYNEARAAYDLTPNYATASKVLERATDLVQISDDYQELVDEADDIMSESG